MLSQKLQPQIFKAFKRKGKLMEVASMLQVVTIYTMSHPVPAGFMLKMDATKYLLGTISQVCPC